MLFLCLRFPYLPLEIFKERFKGPHACVVEEARRVFVASEQAEKRGVDLGMSLATARALIDGGVVYTRNLEQEAQSLHELSQFAYRFTPSVVCYRNDVLLLDIGGSLKLFRGLEALLQTLDDTFAELPHDYCSGIAHTAKAAWLLSFLAQSGRTRQLEVHNLSVETVKQQLSTMPVGLLADFPEAAQRLQHSGIKQLGQVLALPTPELGKRFGIEFVQYLQEITGERIERQGELTQPPNFSRSVDCTYAINDWQLLLLPMKTLLIEFSDYLTKHQLQCSEIHWHLWSPDHQHFDFSVSCQRVFSRWSVLLELTEIKLNSFTLDMAVESVELRCDHFTQAQLLTPSLFEQDNRSQEHFQSLIARLSSRFDQDQVYQLQQKNSHIPEQAYERFPAAQPIAKDPVAKDPQAKKSVQTVLHDRPCWLFESPQRLSYRQEQLYWHGRLTLLQGPERIEANWWQKGVSRDYFVAMHEDKQLCWIYRDRLQQQWYLHGLFT
jgi:protein ImuB